MYYYDIHVFFTRTDGYSVAVESEKDINEDEAIELAVKQDKFTEDGDQYHVDTVTPIDEETYITINQS